MSNLMMVLALLISVRSYAKIQIYAVESPPTVIKISEGLEGLSGEYGKLIAQSIKKAGKEKEFEIVWVPWRRAIMQVDRHLDGLFFPLTRTEEREANYNWVMHITDVDCWLYAVDPKVEVHSFNDLSKYRIGVLGGSAREIELRKYAGKTSKIEGMTEDLSNYRKLQSGRIDIWATQPVVMAEAQRLLQVNGGKPRETRAIKKLFAQSLWLVGNKDMSNKDLSLVQTVFGWGTKRVMKSPPLSGGDFLGGALL